MADMRKKDFDWRVDTNSNGTTPTEHVKFALLMDLRDELKAFNRTLRNIENLARCPNVRGGFIAMRRLALHIEKHGTKPKPKRSKI